MHMQIAANAAVATDDALYFIYPRVTFALWRSPGGWMVYDERRPYAILFDDFGAALDYIVECSDGRIPFHEAPYVAV